MLRTALLFLGLLLGGSALAYAPTQTPVCTYSWASQQSSGSGSGLATEAAARSALQSSYSSQYPTANAFGYHLGACQTTSGSASLTCSAGTNLQTTNVSAQLGTTWICPSGTYVRVHYVSEGEQTCPNGGTLTGGQCVCPTGETDTGTACEAPSCEADEYWSGSTCLKRCPTAGNAWSATDHITTIGASGLTFPQGASTVCMMNGVGADEGNCEIEPTMSPMVCADGKCYAEGGRYTGRMCGNGGTAPTVTPVPDTPTICDEGDLWCLSNGNCGSGFTSGTINGKTICAKIGEAVTITPQPRSPNVPPMNPSLQPNSWTNPSARPGESINPGERVVVSVGVSATTIPGTGGGGGGSGEDGECGLPDTPKCKIDETGTPTSSSADSGATSAVNGGAGSLTGKLNGIGDGSGEKPQNIGWGITSIMFPSTCTPFVLGPFGSWGSFVIDLCQFQSTIHDLMSLVWVSFTLLLSVGMVFRTVTTGGA